MIVYYGPFIITYAKLKNRFDFKVITAVTAHNYREFKNPFYFNTEYIFQSFSSANFSVLNWEQFKDMQKSIFINRQSPVQSPYIKD